MAKPQSDLLYKKIILDLIAQDDHKKLLKTLSFDQLQKFIYELVNDINITTHIDQLIPLQEQVKIIEYKFSKFKEQLSSLCSVYLGVLEDEKWSNYLKSLQQMFAESDLNERNLIDELKALGAKPRKNKNIPEGLDPGLKDFLESFKKYFGEYAVQIENLRSGQLTSQTFVAFFQDFLASLEKYKKDNSCYEMSDIERLVFMVCQEKPELIDLYAEKFDFWLIDEFQDTSPVQDEILNHFVKQKKQFIVGDPQQSIYLFRGARSEVFIGKEKNYKKNKYSTSHLTKNYRSNPELICFINDLFTSVSDSFSAMEPRSDDFDKSQTVAEIAVLPTNLESDYIEENEILYICQEIIKLVNDGVAFDDIAVISRNNEFLNKVSVYLKKFKLPYTFSSGKGFSRKREIIDALSFLKFLLNPNDCENLITLLRTPWFFVSDTQLASYLQNREKNVWQTLIACEEKNEVVADLKTLINETKEKGILDVFKSTLIEKEFLSYSYLYDPSGKRESNFWKLYTLLRNTLKIPGYNLLDFIENLEKDFEIEDGSNENESSASLEPNCINLLTIHASKGLEYKYVFVPQCHRRPYRKDKNEKKLVFDQCLQAWAPSLVDEDGKLHPSPLHLQLGEYRHQNTVAETDRLFYVAITRAERKVYLSYTDKLDKECWANYLTRQDIFKQQEYTIHRVTGLDESFPELKQKAQTSWQLGDVLTFNEQAPARMSVSQLLSQNKTASDLPSEPNDTVLEDQLFSTSFGTLLHKYLEMLKYKPVLELLGDIESKTLQRKADMIQALKFVESCQSPPLLELIRRGKVEWGFQLIENEQIIEGQIDMWSVHQDELWIIDYKTGSAKYTDQAFKQLNYYAKAVMPIAQNYSKVNLAVVYPLQGVVKMKTLKT